MLISAIPVIIKLIALDLSSLGRCCPTKEKVMGLVMDIPISVRGYANKMNKKLGDIQQPMAESAIKIMPLTSSVLWLYLTLSTPMINAKTTPTSEPTVRI